VLQFRASRVRPSAFDFGVEENCYLLSVSGFNKKIRITDKKGSDRKKRNKVEAYPTGCPM